MKIAIIGPGAIGRLFAWTLGQGGHTPLLICRRAEQAGTMQREGLQVVDLEGRQHQVPVAAICLTHEAGQGDSALQVAQFAEVEGVLLSVKSYDTRHAGELLRALPPTIPVLSLQNGLGNGETLAEHLDPSRLAIGLTTHGATAEGNAKVHYKGAGQTVIGDWQPQPLHSADKGAAHWWSELLTACGHQASWTPDIRTEVWKKAMVNIGINPFTALYNLPNGQLLESPSLLRLMRLTVEEAERVADGIGVELSHSFERVLEVCRLTAGNISSMLQDVRAGRQTEIESLCGIIEQFGEQQGMETPYNTMLLELIREVGKRGIRGESQR